jgi:prepilin-type N-terminal cleavage/methylation domain-containing protein
MRKERAGKGRQFGTSVYSAREEAMEKARRGFTLIELLVVIAILAILAAILFPVFAKSREEARQTACLSNLRQIGMGIKLYEQDWDEELPSRLLDDNAKGAVMNYARSERLFICPSDPEPEKPLCLKNPQFGNFGRTSYLYHYDEFANNGFWRKDYEQQVENFNRRGGGGKEKVWLILCVLHLNPRIYWAFNGKFAGKNLTLMGDLHVARWSEPGWTGYGDQ